MGLLVGSNDSSTSIHHNIFAHDMGRNPLVGGSGIAEVINNVVYNWEWDACDFEPDVGLQYGHIIGNYYKKGGNTLWDYGVRLSKTVIPSLFYVHDNIGPTRPIGTEDDWAIVYAGDLGEQIRSSNLLFTPSGITTYSVFDNYNLVLNKAGARPNDRDAVDIRIIQDIINGTGHYINSQTEVGGWPPLAENYHALTIPNNPHDDSGNGYTNLEMWLNAYAIQVET